MRIAVLDDYQRVSRTLADWSRLGPDAEITVFDDHVADPDALVRRLAPFDVLCVMRERTALPRAVIERLANLKLIATTGQRNASIDVAAAAERGIVVSGTGGVPGATAELAWGLILAVLRQIPANDRAMREGRWQDHVGNGLWGKTLGVLGLGNLGRRVAAVGKAFEMTVIAWSQNLTAEKAASAGATLVDKDRLMAESDVLTVHVVLSARTRGLIGAGDLARMKPGSILVNTSRGPIVDEAALVETLRAKRIRGAGIDVYGTEPLPPDHPVRALDNVVLTPHVGYVTEETYRVFYAETVENVAAWRAGTPLRVISP